MNFIKKILQNFDIAITGYSKLQELIAFEDDIKFFMSDQNLIQKVLNFNTKSKAQLKQDLFVLSELNFKKNGFFVEFGATNGIDLSNTYLLEKEFGWNGILAEPAKCWHEDLKKNRTSHIETNCVWCESNAILTFNEVDAAELSTIELYNAADGHRQARENGKTYDVNTISLTDLLDKYKAPHTIDYLSIDTEGSEYDILKNFDFNKYQFNVITCEHNYISSSREKIFDLLTKKGYRRKFTALSRWDDWYVRDK